MKLCAPPLGLSDEELQAHVNVWFDDAPSLRNLAKRICFACPSQTECLREGLAEPSGVWGGLAEGERRNLAELLNERGMTL
jgi:hypothetical protein